MSKIKNDKYYTPINLANHCWSVAIDAIGENFISEIIEPSCGDGSFYHFDRFAPHFGYDIEPECNYVGVKKVDFLNETICYLPGRLVIGNPPYGDRLYMAQRFFRKSIEIADYVAFILPISQLNNTQSMYEFDLIHSEDLGVHSYSGRNLHCCFNVYRRPCSGVLNKRPLSKARDITICRQDSKAYQSFHADVRICYWGDGTCGKILANGEELAAVYAIRINNQAHKDDIMRFLIGFDWRSYVSSISAKKLYQWQIIQVLKSEFDWFM